MPTRRIRPSSPFRTLLASIAVIAASGFGTAAHAGFISTPDINPIFGQGAFGANPVAIHWLAPAPSLVDASLASMDDGDAMYRLADQTPDPLPVVNVFFVDSISFCGDAGFNIIGCSFQSSNVIAMDSSFAAGASGNIGIAHELGHSLGLDHVGGSGNLMNPVLNSSALTSDQAATILGDTRLVQTDSIGGRFIDLRPIAVMAAVIPEPATYAMLLAGLVLVTAAVKRPARTPPPDATLAA